MTRRPRARVASVSAAGGSSGCTHWLARSITSTSPIAPSRISFDEQRGRLRGRRPAVRRERERLLRARHGDVQEAALLLGVEVLALDRLAQQLRREEAAPALPRRPLVLEQLRDEDVRELEALRLVQRHEPHAGDVLAQLDAGRQLAAGLLVGIEVVDEAAEVALRVRLLPVGGEAQEAADVGHGPMRIRRVRAEQVDHDAGQLEVALEDRVRALAPGLVVELVDGRAEPAELGAGRRRRGDGVVALLRIGALALRRRAR